MKNKGISPFKHLCVTIGNLPSSYVDSLSYYECLMYLISHLDEITEATTELQEKYIELKNYVDTYFDNLDVQEEINNKLDEMAESGQLADIIALYLNANCILAYNTVADLGAAENLNDGSFARTYGKLTYNDGYGAYYKIRPVTTSDVIDGDNIVAITAEPTLIAEKIPNSYIGDLSSLDTTSKVVVGAINEIKEDFDTYVENTNEEIESINAKLDITYNYDIVVASDGTGDYTSLTQAVTNASNGDKIFVKKGTYNNEVVNAVGKKLYIVGEDKDETIIQNSYDDYSRPPLNIGKGFIKNLSFKQNSNTGSQGSHAYATHIDNNDLANNDLTFINCSFYSHSSSAVGIGTRNNGILKFKECDFYSDSADSSNYIGAFFIHNATDVTYQGINQICIIESCNIVSNSQCAMHFRYCGDASNYLFIRSINSRYLSENNSIFVYNGVVTADSYNNAPVNIYIDNRSCGNNIAILNHSEYMNDKTNIVGLLANDTIDNTIKRKVLSGTATVGNNTIAVGDTVRTPVHIDGFILKSGIWFPINIKSSDNTNNITAYVTSSSIMLDTTIDGNYIIILDYT